MSFHNFNGSNKTPIWLVIVLAFFYGAFLELARQCKKEAARGEASDEEGGAQ